MGKHPVIGLLGGGQLGRMLQEAASPLNVELAILDAAGSPAKQICENTKHVSGSFNDPAKIRELAARVDVLTVEIEHVDADVLEEIATKGVSVGAGQPLKKVPCHPSWETIRLIQDKYLQKEHFLRAGIPVAPQVAVEGEAALTTTALQAVGDKYGFPFMLKARKGSYDGRGNFLVRDPADFDEAIRSMGKLSLYAEKFQPFVKELSVMVVRTEDDDGKLRDVHPYPAVETVHEDSICTKVFLPPRGVPAEACEEARKVASNVIRTLKGRGVYAVEMFVLKDGSIVVNEVAPRPHNSGHLFTEAVPYMSQFKAQLCAILDIFPGKVTLQPRVESAIMLNVLGGAAEESHETLVDMASRSYDKDMDVYIHLYGKASKPGRKIGHITVTSPSAKVSGLEQLAGQLTKEVDSIREGRLASAAAQLRPSDSAAAPAPSKPASSRSRSDPLVVVTMGSDSDLPVLKGAFEVLELFGVPYDYTITSAHRTPQRMVELGQAAAARGVRVLIAAAGGAAHLPGMLASETTLPVIGVPVRATHLDGQDSLLSIVQMPRGCPVATVGINNSTNAGLLAVKILGCTDERYAAAMARYMKTMSDEVEAKAGRLEEIGWEAYLEKK
ncbi:phosphoribosylaminoimidazole carboxylase [Cordyceps fumosorosea ARSEF 2679]|uniref:Phosphoribosylaminoimidazole carboxylase n=1 Tax=Cordyceps fumosorosea (strain ARSEF 2679) TaxID=1081104 RepID=A0A167SW11_CORFA|nr:phosphoribosylaminoimidazole carboxylase [Cordyceps fumosorosea ARSEF 2679]OAA59983.1 phosphoribosylaminoimidazole carboxylase [Cordyceps fumosorosea ARSEF 2679]